MRKQTLLAGAMAAVFILVAAGASLAAERRGPYRSPHYRNGGPSAATPYGSHWKRAPAFGHRWQHRAPSHRPGFHAPRYPYGHRPGDRRGWQRNPSYHNRPDHFGRRPAEGYRHGHGPSGTAFRPDQAGRGDFGQSGGRASFDGPRSSGRGQDNAAVAADDGGSGRTDRHSSGRQGQR